MRYQIIKIVNAKDVVEAIKREKAASIVSIEEIIEEPEEDNHIGFTRHEGK